MSWGQTYSFKLVFALDLWGATLFFGQFGLSISSLAGLVREGKDAPLNLWGWQRGFLRWLEPKLSRAHCKDAIAYDRDRAQKVLSLLAIEK